MGIKLYSEPVLEKPELICSWPGIGRIGVLAVDYLRRSISAKELGEIEPWDFFEPNKVIIKNGLIEQIVFPENKFYYQKLNDRDVILFIGEEQPSDGTNPYASGEKAYKMANLILDVAEKYNCPRIYTSGAAVTQVHHTQKPKVWAVPNNDGLLGEVKKYENTVLMSGGEGASAQGSITGLNGLLIGAAQKRGIDALCLMGEVPYYLQASPWPYPKGAASVLEVLAANLGITIDTIPLLEMAKKMDEAIDKFLDQLHNEESVPVELRNNIKEAIDKLKETHKSKGPITDEDQKRIMEHLDDFFKRGEGGDETRS